MGAAACGCCRMWVLWDAVAEGCGCCGMWVLQDLELVGFGCCRIWALQDLDPVGFECCRCWRGLWIITPAWMQGQHFLVDLDHPTPRPGKPLWGEHNPEQRSTAPQKHGAEWKTLPPSHIPPKESSAFPWFSPSLSQQLPSHHLYPTIFPAWKRQLLLFPAPVPLFSMIPLFKREMNPIHHRNDFYFPALR